MRPLWRLSQLVALLCTGIYMLTGCGTQLWTLREKDEMWPGRRALQATPLPSRSRQTAPGLRERHPLIWQPASGCWPREDPCANLCRIWKSGERQSIFCSLLDPLMPVVQVLAAGVFISASKTCALQLQCSERWLWQTVLWRKTLWGYSSLSSSREIISILGGTALLKRACKNLENASFYQQKQGHPNPEMTTFNINISLSPSRVWTSW